MQVRPGAGAGKRSGSLAAAPTLKSRITPTRTGFASRESASNQQLRLGGATSDRGAGASKPGSDAHLQRCGGGATDRCILAHMPKDFWWTVAANAVGTLIGGVLLGALTGGLLGLALRRGARLSATTVDRWLRRAIIVVVVGYGGGFLIYYPSVYLFGGEEKIPSSLMVAVIAFAGPGAVALMASIFLLAPLSALIRLVRAISARFQPPPR